MADSGDLDGRSLSAESFRLLLDMISDATSGNSSDYGLRCEIRRDNNSETIIETTGGRMTFRGRAMALVSEDA